MVDNGSTDDTAAVMAPFCREGVNPGFHYIREPRVGKSFAINTGIGSARGSIVAFTDDDVTVERRWISEIIEEFQREPYLGLLAGRVESADSKGPSVAVTRARVAVPLSAAEPLEGLVLGCNLAVRREVLVRVPGLDTRLGPGRGLACNDIDFAYRVLCAGFRGIFSPRPVVYHDPGLRDRAREYRRGWGAFYVKFLLRGDRRVARQAWWRVCRIVRDLQQNGRGEFGALAEEVWHLLAGAGVMLTRMSVSLFTHGR